MSIEYANPQFTWTTAEDEEHLFSGEVSDNALVETDAQLPTGQYRVIDGRLFLIVNGVPQLP